MSGSTIYIPCHNDAPAEVDVDIDLFDLEIHLQMAQDVQLQERVVGSESGPCQHFILLITGLIPDHRLIFFGGFSLWHNSQ